MRCVCCTPIDRLGVYSRRLRPTTLTSSETKWRWRLQSVDAAVGIMKPRSLSWSSSFVQRTYRRTNDSFAREGANRRVPADQNCRPPFAPAAAAAALAQRIMHDGNTRCADRVCARRSDRWIQALPAIQVQFGGGKRRMVEQRRDVGGVGGRWREAAGHRPRNCQSIVTPRQPNTADWHIERRPTTRWRPLLTTCFLQYHDGIFSVWLFPHCSINAARFSSLPLSFTYTVHLTRL